MIIPGGEFVIPGVIPREALINNRFIDNFMAHFNSESPRFQLPCDNVDRPSDKEATVHS